METKTREQEQQPRETGKVESSELKNSTDARAQINNSMERMNWNDNADEYGLN
jgi:hypothetical protein